jgi:hypothetical protein
MKSFKYLMVLTIVSYIGLSLSYGQATLKHSYTFTDGTANDEIGTAHGVLNGDATIKNGAVLLTGNGFVGLPGKDINVPTYSSVSIEAVFKQGLGLENFFSVLYAFGETNPSVDWMGIDYFIFQPTRQDNDKSRFSISCDDTDSPWGTETGINGKEILDTAMHYVVTILTPTEMKLYLDGALLGTEILSEKNKIANLSNDTVLIGASVYPNDAKWIGEFHEMNIFEGELDAARIVSRAELLLGIPVADAFLSDITSNRGTLSPVFDPETDIYELFVEYGSTQVILEAIPEVKGAKIEMFDGLGNEITDGIVNFSGDGIDLEIVVTALNGTTQQSYFVSIFLDPKEKTASLSGITLSTGTLLSKFNLDSLNYIASVPNGTATVNITGIPAWSGATVSGGGNVTLTNGEGSTSITVNSVDGSTTKVYKVDVADAFYIVNEASGLVISDVENQPQLATALNKEQGQLFEFVASGVDGQYYIKNLIPRYLSSKAGSTWDMTMVDNLSNDLDTCRFILHQFEAGRYRIETVIKEGADRRFIGTNSTGAGEYIFNDKFIDDAYAVWNILAPAKVVDPYDTYLSNLSIDEIGLNPAFDAGKQEYYVTLPIGTSSINIDAVANDATATITGTGSVDVPDASGSITVTVTATDDTYKRNYVIHYQKDTPLTLKHSYSFANGTAQDHEGNADGIVAGGTIVEGIYNASEEGDYITLPAKTIALNTYPSITFEAYVLTGENLGWTMLAYFGGLNGSNTIWMSIAGETDLSRIAMDQGSGTYSAEGIEPGSAENHHYVGIVTNDSLSWFVDGSLVVKGEINPNYAIRNTSTENAWIGKGGYPDPTWIGSIFEFNIYSGQMDAETVAARAYNFPVEDATSDATLSDLTVDGTTVTAFSPYNLSYEVVLPKSTTSVPEVTAAATSASANAEVTEATEIPGSTLIVVTAEDGVTTATYSVNFAYEVSAEATLTDLTVDGITIAGFDALVLSYDYILGDDVTTVPTVLGMAANASASVVVNAATAIPGITTVVVTAEDGSTSNTYSIKFKYDLSADATLSDLKVNGTTINGFSSSNITYLVNLSEGTTTVPTVTATSNDSGASVVVTSAASIPGTTTIVVTAKDGVTKKTYSITFSIGTAIAIKESIATQVYPTVFTTSFKVITAGGIHKISIFDVSGKFILKQKEFVGETEISISKAGMYIVKVEGNGVLETFKVFKLE